MKTARIDLFLRGLRALHCTGYAMRRWALITLGDWQNVLPPIHAGQQVPDAPVRRSFLRFVVRSTESKRGCPRSILSGVRGRVLVLC